MEKIDWDYWLKRKSLFEIEVALLTLGIDPENHQIDYLGDHYLVDMNALKSMQKDYIRRMTFIQENRFTPYEYMANDGESGNFYFDTEGRVRVKRFLLWLKNEDMGWELPPELQAYIDSLGKPSKTKLIKITQQKLSPKEWNPLAEQYATELLQSNADIGIDDTAKKIADMFEKEEILSVRSDLIKPETIKRYLSDWGFNLKRIQVNKK
ncbi:hypothetical protein [Polynucleobacter sp.]|uniref:hypothetical protein n=1 Tax=Polynucleobacter sp. TaxID=2029855 RepID=UPI00301910EE